jgi:hypothetical protein
MECVGGFVKDLADREEWVCIEVGEVANEM